MGKYIGVKIVQAEPESKDGVDGYKVVYPIEEGQTKAYESWCPKAIFKKHNRPIDGMTFGDAIAYLKKGGKVSRRGWNGKGMWINLQNCDEHNKMTLPYLYIEYPCGHPAYPDGSRVPWLASQTDMLQEDWTIVD